MTPKYVVVGRPPGFPGVTLYAARRYRVAYDAALSEKFSSAMQWKKLGPAESRANEERMRLPNSVYGYICFKVEPIQARSR